MCQNSQDASSKEKIFWYEESRLSRFHAAAPTVRNDGAITETCS